MGYGIKGQIASAVATEELLYTVPDNKAYVGNILICNRGAADTFRIWVIPGGGATSNEYALFYDTPIGVNATIEVTTGLSLRETDEVKVYSTNGTLSFTIFGKEFEQ